MELIPLNIMVEYPVHWTEFQVFRDFIQNFFDARGDRDWETCFQHTYQDGVLRMEGKDTGFAYEWLMHIGAGSKRDRENAAGYFGEGFKIAALCAVRDYGWDVVMSSRDWKVRVVQQEAFIDGVPCRQLAYELYEETYSQESVLTLRGVSREQYRLFQDALLGFFYPGNPLFGEVLYEDHSLAVCRRSGKEIPSSLPITEGYGKRGILFGRYQAVGTLPIPFVIADHTLQQEDRERKSLTTYQILKVLYQIASKVDPKTAAQLLRSLSGKWHLYPARLVDIDSWYYVLCALIRNAARDENVRERFLLANPNLLYGDRFWETDVNACNRRRIAKVWMKSQDTPYRMVIEQFKLLGVRKLEDACEEAGGYQDRSEPTGRERQYIGILRAVVHDLFGFFFVDWDVPVHVLRTEERTRSILEGRAEVMKRAAVRNSLGIEVRFRLESVSILEGDLAPQCFGAALSTYLHELAHMFGGDNTKNFSAALTYLLQFVIEKAPYLSSYRQEWDSIGGTREEGRQVE